MTLTTPRVSLCWTADCERWYCAGCQCPPIVPWRGRPRAQGTALSRQCCAARASCGCPTATPLPSIGRMLASTLKFMMRVTGEGLSPLIPNAFRPQQIPPCLSHPLSAHLIPQGNAAQPLDYDPWYRCTVMPVCVGWQTQSWQV